jgi:PTS system N-acetylgalactosamine-specific IIA component
VIKTIITGHGNFATGLKSALELLSGEHKEIMAIDFTETMSEKDLAVELENVSKGNVAILYFTDFAGGTPFKEAAKISVLNKKIEVVSGCNLNALLESIFKEYDSVKAYAQDLVKITKDTAKLADFSEPISTKNFAEDGI